MDIKKKVVLTALLMAGLVANSSWAAPVVTIGNGTGYGTSLLNNTALDPSFPNTKYPRYQQVYGASAFTAKGITGPIAINSLTFFALTEIEDWFSGELYPLPASSQVISQGDYTIRLSTTSAGVDALSATFNSNWGADVQTFFSGSFAGNSLTFNGSTPFLYDPTMGNLLLDITVNSQTPSGGYLLRDAETLAQYNNVATRDQMSSRYGNNTTTATTTGQPYTRSGGYKTEFGYQDPATASVPEPGTLVMFGLGLLALGFAAQSRRGATIA